MSFKFFLACGQAEASACEEEQSYFKTDFIQSESTFEIDAHETGGDVATFNPPFIGIDDEGADGDLTKSVVAPTDEPIEGIERSFIGESTGFSADSDAFSPTFSSGEHFSGGTFAGGIFAEFSECIGV